MTIKSLSSLAQAWKDKEVTNEEAREIFKILNIIKVKESDYDDEIRYISGNGNSWTELRTDTNLNRKERIAFKKAIEYIKEEENGKK